MFDLGKSAIGLCVAASLLSACQPDTSLEADAPETAATPVAAQSTSMPTRAAKSVPQQVFLTGRAVADGIAWAGRGSSRQPSSRLFFAATATNIGGETAICGVQIRTGVGSTRFNSQVANAFYFQINGEDVLRNLAYFSRAASVDDVTTTPAACKTTGIPWEDSFATAPWNLSYRGGSRFTF